MTSGEHSLDLSSTVFLLSPDQTEDGPETSSLRHIDLLSTLCHWSSRLQPQDSGSVKFYLPLLRCLGLLVLLESLSRQLSEFFKLQSMPVAAES